MEPFQVPQGKPKKNGEVYKFSNGATYVGGIRNGKMQGFGTYEDPSGSKYVGDWSNGLQHGQGVCDTADGERYSGSYENGVPHGKGTYRFKNGNVYEGEYMHGKIHGQGTIRFPDNRRYMGEFRDNKKSGKGRYEGANGIYEGDYFDGKKNGFGTFTWIDGSKYEGPWKNDLMHGEGGTKTEKDGRVYRVIYDGGKLVNATPLQAPPSNSGSMRSSSRARERAPESSQPFSHQSLPASLGSNGFNSRKTGRNSEIPFQGTLNGQDNRTIIETPSQNDMQMIEKQPGWWETQWENVQEVLSCGGAREKVQQQWDRTCGGGAPG